MNNEFYEQYARALNRCINAMEALGRKGVLIAGVDDALIEEYREAQAEVNRYQTIMSRWIEHENNLKSHLQ